MNKFLKIFGISILSLIIILYISFLFILPNVININKFKPEIQKIAKEQSKLSFDFENAKIITTPLLGVGIKANNVSINLPDGTLLFSTESIKTRISIPSIFLLTVKISCLEIENPVINLEIANNEQFKIIKIVEEIINAGKEQKLEISGGIKEEKGWFNPAWIKIKVPNIVINNYKVLINDLASDHYLKLLGEKLTIGYFNGKRIKLKTFAEFYSDESKNITANVNIDSFLPPPAPALDKEDDPAERIDIPFINPVTMYQNYDLKANLDSKLKVRNSSSGINSYGFFNIENITLKVSQLKLPESYLRAKTFGKNITLDTNLYPAKDQNIELLGKLNYSKHPKLDMSIKTAHLQFNDMLILAKAFLDSLSIYNELDKIIATGEIKTDCYLKTNFKKLVSKGSVIIRDGGINVKNIGKVIANANINLILDNNLLDIQNSSLFINNSKVFIDGRIDKKSVADISVKAEKVPLPILFEAFAPKSIRNAYLFNSGDANLELNLNGKLKNAIATVKAGLDNLYIADKAKNFIIQNKKFNTEIFIDSKAIRGLVNNDFLSVEIPKTKSFICVPKFETEIDKKNIIIKENKINFNDNTSLTYYGELINYEKLDLINFRLNGDVSTDDLVKLIGKEFKPFIHYTGSIPVKVTFDGNSKKQTLFAQALANKTNYITPVDYIELQDKDVSLQSTIDFKGNRIKIKNTGLKIREIIVDEKGKETITYDTISDIDGTIENNRINLIKINLPKILHGKIFAFPNSRYELNGKAYDFGETLSPRMRGGFELRNLSIPELLLDLRKIELKFRGHEGDLILEDLLLNGSDIQTKCNFSLIPTSVFNILNLDVASRYFNLDRVMTVSERALKYIPTSTTTTTQTSTPVDIPVVIHNGKIDFARIITGNIDLRNTFSRISMRNNLFRLHNLRTKAFDGNINGNIDVNLITMLLDIAVKGKNVDVEKALLDACAMKDTLSGNADFKANISLQGVTLEEQMKSLKGNVEFDVKDGQFGPFGRLENLILAENIRESQFFQTALGGIISGLLTIDTTHFSELKGNLSFDDGICHIEPITSLGDILSLHIFGDFDLLRNYADMKVRARMASLISNLLGPIGAINPANLISNAASLNIVTAKAFSIFCEMVPEEELETLPSFANSYIDNAATKFQIVVRGDIAKPLSLVKSFKWLAGQTEYQNAIDYVNSLPEQLEDSTATTVEELLAEDAKYKKSLKYKFKQMFDKEEKVEIQTPELKPEAEIIIEEIENNAQE